MLDLFGIFDRRGVVLFRADCGLNFDDNGPINMLIREVLQQERSAGSSYSTRSLTLRWMLSNETSLIYVAGYPKTIPAPYAMSLLADVRVKFEKIYKEKLLLKENENLDTKDFHNVFKELHIKAEKRTQSTNNSLQQGHQSGISSTSAKSSSSKQSLTKKSSSSSGMIPKNESLRKTGNTRDVGIDYKSEVREESMGSTVENGVLLSEEQIKANKLKLLAKKRSSLSSKKSKTMSSVSSSETGGETGVVETGKKREKVMRKSANGENSAEDLSALDYSDHVGADLGVDREVTQSEIDQVREKFLLAAPNEAYDLIAVSENEETSSSSDEELNGEGETQKNKASSGIYGLFQRLTGQHSLTNADLQPVLSRFEEQLMSKNVAPEIAEKLVQSVGSSLVGKRLESMSSVKSSVKTALEDALTRLLTPKQSTELLADVEAVTSLEKRPFVVVFCGVNGVGKSTSLAKTCYYLQKHGKKVLVAACDTFRAGAVEQLKTHAACLDVALYHQGYGKDAAGVAKEAIRLGAEQNVDVVLVDTAGRMQHNEPLMRALAKLVSVNQPDRIFFVGEALVGNDAVDQLQTFNSALSDYQNTPNPRQIDGIVLTKFDTIDDKVGAAVSMVYTTGQPIVFVGVGQTYMDLRKVSTSALVKSLLA